MIFSCVFFISSTKNLQLASSLFCSVVHHGDGFEAVRPIFIFNSTRLMAQAASAASILE